MFLNRFFRHLSILLVLGLVLIFASFSNAQTSTPTPTPDNSQQVSDLQKKINDLQSKISDLQSQERTLSSQIAVMNNQIKLTEYQIASTEEQITNLTLDIDTATKKISGLENSLNELVLVLMNRVVATYEIGTIQPLQILLTSTDASDFLSRLNYLRRAQAHDKKLIYETQQAKIDYTNQKEIYEDKKKEIEKLKAQLVAYTNQLDQEKQAKQRLLSETQGSEANYQRFLAQAKAEYEAIVGIIAGKGTESEVRKVNQGDVIATIIPTASCNSTGPHLHFTVSRDGSAQDPFGFLKSIEYTDNSGGDTFNPSGSWDWPIDSPIKFNQGFGDTWYVRTYHFYPTHNGIDISGPSLTVRAVKSGTMFRGSYAGYKGCTLPYVRVDHNDDGLDTFYLHVYSN
ncbi:MAG: hypothetical protein A3B38_03070 [Candidatus Levybacteria bacterium RIFCSPLOWO2_01_FULL_36_13]|nr:MAG: hypothetical protein A2684_04160 [Candidatus Levybacteria bacterium RIFCSPHIGHO2_01_FULL_36_15b]OGH35872.1 MAG: hypothetical protein A3B38_03070 [Candidatus Levybacteria bacterium RIFCSPLOWO2_01_FULL_36_13]